MKALINANLYDFNKYRSSCYVLFDTHIEEVGDMKDYKGADQVFDCKGMLVMPGLTNCHTHIYSAFSRGMGVPFNPRNFTDILKQLWWKLDSKLDCDDVFMSGLVYGADCIKSGVTSIIDHHASGLCVKGSLDRLKGALCDELNLRGLFCFETSDRFNVDECIEENLKFGENTSENCTGLFGMHASMSLSDASLSKISSLLGNMPVHIHVAESVDDVEDCRMRYNKSIVERLESFNLLKENSILSHCVHINDKDAAVISGNGCYIALNPTSNMNNAVGLPNYGMFKENNVRCLIGNDGLGANITRDYLNIAFAMKYRLKSPTGFGLEDLSSMIKNGYEYIGKLLNIKIGRLEKGYKADMLAVPYVPPTPMDEGNALGHLFFGVLDNFHPRDVWVNGQCLMRDFALERELEDMYTRSRALSEKVWERVNC